MGSALAVLVLVVVLALAFDYINGFHDTANAVATVVSTNVLPGRTAVLLAAAANFLGAFGCHRVLHGGAAGGSLWGLLTSKGVLLTLQALVLSPLAGLAGGFVLMGLLLWAVRPLRPEQVNRSYRVLQLGSAGFMAFAH